MTAPSTGTGTRESFVRLERELGLLLRRARAVSAKNAAQLHPDLDPAALGLLALLQDAGPLRASDLVARLGLDKSTVSRQLTGLVDLGLVDRTPDPADGRAQVLRPSAEGASRLERIRAARRARLEEDLASWPAEDVARLGELLGRLNETMLVLSADVRRPAAG
jgi:DNA-binding MarR family transcriptional regulator